MKNSYKTKNLKPHLTKMKNLKDILISGLVLLLISCGNDNNNTNPSNETVGSVNIMIDNVMKNSSDEKADLLLQAPYINVNGDTLVFSKFKYYISNIKLISALDTSIVPESYHLISSSETSPSTVINLRDIPSGTYSEITYSIGIDSIANLDETIIEGDLDPSSDMSWNWQVGYKFFNMEGIYSSDTSTSNPFLFHIGQSSNIRTTTIQLPQELVVTNNSTSMVHIMANINNFFGKVNVIDLDVSNNVKVGPADVVSKIVENYEDGLMMIHHIEN